MEGLQVINDNNIIQIDSNYKNQKLLWNGTLPPARFGGSLNLTGIINPTVECPLIFVRTTGLFGGSNIKQSQRLGQRDYPSEFGYYSSEPVDIAIFSASAPDPTQQFGFQVFNSAGVSVYNSSNKYARIQEIAILNGSVSSDTTTFPNQISRPWICANPIGMSLEAPLGSGSEISYPPWMIVVSYTNNSISYTMPDSADILSRGKALDSRLNPYNGRTLQIPIGIIPGL